MDLAELIGLRNLRKCLSWGSFGNGTKNNVLFGKSVKNPIKYDVS
jgi:hypothetical protein